MEALKRKYDNFKKCYDALGRVITVQNELKNIAAENINAQELFTAGVIQYFKIAYETAWKFLKEYLTEIHGSDAASPKTVFRACESYHIFPTKITNELITLADARNTTTHIYDQILAQEVFNSIIKHYEVFGYILNNIKIPKNIN